jgi:hypothetical protein
VLESGGIQSTDRLRVRSRIDGKIKTIRANQPPPAYPMASAMFRALLLTTLILLNAAACESKNQNVSPENLVGHWKSGTRQSEWGEVVIELTFTKDGSFRMEHRFTEEPEPLVLEGGYTAEGGKITSSVFKSGQSIEFWFEGKKLVLREDNGPVHYSRKR